MCVGSTHTRRMINDKIVIGTMVEYQCPALYSDRSYDGSPGVEGAQRTLEGGEQMELDPLAHYH